MLSMLLGASIFGFVLGAVLVKFPSYLYQLKNLLKKK